MQNDNSDSELVQAALGGSDEAFQILYEKYDQKVVRQAARKEVTKFASLFQSSENETGWRATSHIDIAIEVISQEAWMKVFRKGLEQWDPISSKAQFAPYLRTISKNCANNLGEKLRAIHYGSREIRSATKKTTNSTIENQDTDANKDGKNGDWKPVRTFVAITEKSMPTALLTEASETSGEVTATELISLIEKLPEDLSECISMSIEGLSAKEMSERTGTNQNTMKSRLQKAKQLLKTEAQKHLDQSV